jgi:hypothetical protein
MAQPRCKATTRAGKRCRRASRKGSDECAFHSRVSTGSDRFGSPGQAREAGRLGGRPRVPRVSEAMRERVEEEIDTIVAPYFEALKGAMIFSTYEGTVIVSQHPDLGARIAAAEKLLNRVYGKPRQVQEVAGEGGGPVRITDEDLADPEVRKALREAGKALARRRAVS